MKGKQRSNRGQWLLIVALAWGFPSVAPADLVDFQRDVWTIFQDRCIRCHGPAKQKSSLRLDSRAALVKGGDNGPAVVAGEPGKSRLLELVSGRKGDLRMPPDGEALSAAQVATLRRWIAEGANWPANFAPTQVAAKHWAFEPVSRFAAPEVKGVIHNPIDAFLTAKLVERGLRMSTPADPHTLIRRLTLDLTGLPPTPDQVETFVDACSGGGEEKAYRTLLDQLLASPRYGERWAQHWLDVIRYADTSGYEFNGIRPSAWPYRDYVIAALNADLSYPRFILEQLAGDTLGVDPATGFLVTPPFPSRIEVGQDAAGIAQARYNGLDEVVQNLGSAILGMTVGCARCHDHKFDPVSTRDYYRLVATFAGLQFVDRPWRTGALPTDDIRSAEKRLADIRNRLKALPAWREVELVRTTDFFQPVTAKWIKLTVRGTFTGQGYAPAIDEIEVWTPESNGEPPRNVGSAKAGARIRSSGPDQSLGAKDAFLNDGQVGSQSRWVARDRIDQLKAWVEIELPEPTLIHRLVTSCDFQEQQGSDVVAAQWRTLKQWQIEVAEKPGQWRTIVPANRDQGLAEAEVTRRKALEKQFTEAAGRLWELQNIFAGRFRTPELSHVLRRGNPMEPREATGPGGIDVLGGYELPADAAEAERRLALARWLGRKEHPLTARVLVNRVWRHHFGAGLVDTPSDFGTQGERPTHPELLDWLASEFMARGWKLKDLHRLICTSAAYRQSSRPDPAALKVDADARLLWRFPPRRLEAEAIRDSVLFASGSLDLTMGGPGVNFYQPRTKSDTRWLPLEKPGRETWRRTIYLLRVRGADDGLFQPFDLPDCGQVRAKRSTSTTPLQAMNLLNSPFMIEQAHRLADRAQQEAGKDVGRQVQRVFKMTLARPPADHELAACARAARQHGLATVARALFYSNEFLFLE